MLTSILTPKPQPATATYGLDALELLQAISRAAYEAAGGPLVPYDKTRPLQPWFISNQPAGSMSFTGIVNPGTGARSLGRFTSPDPSTPNFAGLPNYPAWSPAETVAMNPHAAPSPPSPVDKNGLSSIDQAQMLQKILGGTLIDEGTDTFTFNGIEIEFPIDYGSETRRAYALALANGKRVNVGIALGQMYAKGIGWPGAFVADATQVSGFSFKFAVLDDGSTASTVGALPVPCRELNTNGAVDEILVTSAPTGLLGNQVTVIARTDMQPQGSQNPAPPSSGNTEVLTAIADFRAWLTQKLGA